MGLKINKIYIKNFKVFEEIELDFSEKKLTVFDGPNGFGKTTLYDAIELLLTGRIRQYQSLDNIIDNRENYEEIPFYNINGDGTPIVIKAEIEISIDSQVDSHILIRKTEDKASLNESKFKHDFSVFNLYEADSFESLDENYSLVDEPDQFLRSILGENYLENFEFLNYVEQEESYYMLKHKDKERKNSIQHLFNTKEYQNQLAKIKAIKKHVQDLKKPLPDAIADYKASIEKIKENLSSKEVAEYKQLFENKEHAWDKEKIDFESITITDILGKDGVLFNIENLVLNRDEFKKQQKNVEIQTVAAKSQTVLNQLLKFDKFVDKKEDVLNEKTLLSSITRFVDNCKIVDSKNIADGLLDIDANITNKFPDKEEITLYNQKLKSIKELIKSSNKTSKLHSDMSGTRNSFIQYFEQYNKESGEESESCPLCGYDWTTQEKLLLQIQSQTEELKSLSENITQGLTTSINDFKEQELSKLLELLNSYAKKTYYQEEYFVDFTGIDAKKIQSAKKYLQDNKIEFVDLINTDTNPSTVIKLDALIKRLNEKIVAIDTEKIQSNFNELYTIYFKESEDLLFTFEANELEKKRKYVEWQYSLYQSTQLTKLNQQLLSKQNKLELLIRKDKELKDVIDTYNTSLKKYNAEVIKDIELLFHIYTGRILLDYQGGLGLFIKNDKDGLRFVTTPKKTYDALFSMSAGQLSALIISFTLSLNKIYSRNKVLLIDDPVQTMDEINISGCIELLRNEFSDRQIFISTHESMMSTYMRYKFEKYNLSTKRINVKELSKN